MLRLLIIVALAIAAVLVVGFGALVYIFIYPRMTRHVHEDFMTDNGKFRIRVTARGENGGIMAGAYYIFESAPLDAERWTQITTFRHDDPVPIPRDQLRFLRDDVAYVFMGWMYAVTTDGGQSWSLWQADRDLPHWQCCNYRLVEDVVLHKDGSGTMTLRLIPERSGEVPRLETRDFGVHWQIPAPN